MLISCDTSTTQIMARDSRLCHGQGGICDMSSISGPFLPPFCISIQSIAYETYGVSLTLLGECGNPSEQTLGCKRAHGTHSEEFDGQWRR